ncbi:hypothetical protein L195_g032055 [Trifolium pratense]|uniref:TF-B3 domain-containing protein n=2 Tax=Trifolium pratense TaxID=57577 RepID=A0A2K3LC48_TRIPR|nr:hypothetical protein L195_g032055 [Trifolium pratense]CAJ2651911.1 unnamed protein product [Trifolium pratense]
MYELEPTKENPSSTDIPIKIPSDDNSSESDGSIDRKLEEIVSFARSLESLEKKDEGESVNRDERVQQQAVNEGEDYRWTRVISDAFAKGKSVLHFPSYVCNDYPFSLDHQLKVINRDTNYTITCTVAKANTKIPQFQLGGAWYGFVKRMNLKEKDKLSFLLDNPPTVLTVWKD